LPDSVGIEKGSDMRRAVGDKHGDNELRRSEDCKYLPGLKQSSFNPDVAQRVIEYWSNKGDTIVDPFAGHSTRMLVSKFLERNYIGFEIAKMLTAFSATTHIITSSPPYLTIMCR